MIIKPEWIRVQEGLYAELHTFAVKGLVKTRYNLYSQDGWCFYHLNDENEVPVYSDWAMTPYSSIDEINSKVRSIRASEQKQPSLEVSDEVDKN